MDAQFLTSLLGQFPVVGLVIWLFLQFRKYENESRARWFAYMRDRDERLDETLREFSAGQKSVAVEINTLGQCVTRLDARLKG